jgi:hypothetical protein
MNADRLNKNLLNLAPETPLFRITKLQFLLADMEKKVVTLPRIIEWDDPHEAAYFNRKVLFEGQAQLSLSSPARDWFGQCWTICPESDAMWRIYNLHLDSVRIGTTAGELLQAVTASAVEQRPAFEKWAANSLFMGRVDYHGAASMQAKMMTPVRDVLDPSAGGLAKMLMQKRDEFSHEREVRFLYQSLQGGAYLADNLDDAKLYLPELRDYKLEGQLVKMHRFIQLPFDWKCIRTTIVGPRVTEDDFLKTKIALQNAASWLTISQSTLYDGPSYPGKF